ncbi:MULTISPECIES: hypothetical protein [Cysteiniphilum]|uniref:hypothetical protein n=1 Tax=Cysteiniphilum TaxID=2056696 RepID=UPI001785A2FB|nr:MULTISPECIES: hypothetical protein [Cysteiniphilum]
MRTVLLMILIVLFNNVFAATTGDLKMCVYNSIDVNNIYTITIPPKKYDHCWYYGGKDHKGHQVTIPSKDSYQVHVLVAYGKGLHCISIGHFRTDNGGLVCGPSSSFFYISIVSLIDGKGFLFIVADGENHDFGDGDRSYDIGIMPPNQSVDSSHPARLNILTKYLRVGDSNVKAGRSAYVHCQDGYCYDKCSNGDSFCSGGVYVQYSPNGEWT